MESGYQRKTAFEGQRVLNRVTAGEGVWGLERDEWGWGVSEGAVYEPNQV